jgi:hypothetical protein
LAIDCQGISCDQEFIRTQITFVDHVRERQDATVHVLITSQSTASGGQEITFSFFGQGPFMGRNHVIQQTLRTAVSIDDTRREMVRILSLGLVPYAIQSSRTQDLTVTPVRQAAALVVPQSDPWKHWTFRSQIGGTGSGERSTTFTSINGSFSANRTTEEVKINVAGVGGYAESSFELPEGEHYVSLNRNFGTSALFVRSLGSHWSAGVRGALSSTTFQNINRSWYVAPAVEYDVFPYEESTRRLLTIHYSAGMRWFDYNVETLFGKLSERRPAQLVSVALTARQRWGTVGAGVDAASYLPDVKYNNLNAWTNIDLSVYRGLALNLSVDLSSIRDQLYLPRGRATAEEILVRQRQLATRYQYFYSFGISYTFGSIYSPIVNPRFQRGGF